LGRTPSQTRNWRHGSPSGWRRSRHLRRDSSPRGFKNEVQIVITVLQHDLENEPDVLGMIGASAALAIAGVPFAGPIAAARIGLILG